MKRRTAFMLLVLALGGLYRMAAQPLPDDWKAFVSSSKNPFVTDTFRMQTFESPGTDNWNYSGTGEIAVVNATENGISGQGGDCFLKLPLPSSIEFEPYDLSIYEEVKIKVYSGYHNLMTKEYLWLESLRQHDTLATKLYDPANNNESRPFRITSIGSMPYSLSLTTRDPYEISEGGYYMLDSAYASGSISEYSLFSGEGNWLDSVRWSHLPVARYRTALIKEGVVRVTDTVSCRAIHLDSATLQIKKAGLLHVSHIHLYEDRYNLFSEAALAIDSSLVLHKSFAEKGAWYFISFPFDVYPAGVDAAFSLRDEQESGEGNYFYAKQYNSGQRASQGSGTSNWETIPAAAMKNEGTPLFEKNKGYLIALDAGADRVTLTFTAAAASLPAEFAAGGTIGLQAGFGEREGDNGWYICGNPLPSSLPLRRIAPDPALGEQIYVFDGNEYQEVPLDSNYALAPLSTFFVKTKENKVLTILPEVALPQPVILLDNPGALRYLPGEPQDLPVGSVFPSGQSPSVFLSGHYIYVSNISLHTKLTVVDALGRTCFHEALPPGNPAIYLPLPKGLYILRLESPEGSLSQKVVIR